MESLTIEFLDQDSTWRECPWLRPVTLAEAEWLLDLLERTTDLPPEKIRILCGPDALRRVV